MRYIISFLCASLGLGLAPLGAAPLWAGVPRVVTDIPVVQSLAAQVMGDLGQPVLLLEKGASAHEFQLRPSQAGALADAGLVLWVGPELTPWLDRALQGLAPDVPRLALLDAPETLVRNYDAEAASHADHDDHHGTDPHAWLNPENARVWVGLIAQQLASLDPEHAAIYAANAAATQAQISALNAEISAQLAPTKGVPFVVFHDAYGYFADYYGLSVAGSIALGDAAPPGAARLSQLRETIAAGGAICVFPELYQDPALVTQIAEGTDIRVGAPLDPEGRDIEPGPGTYGEIMHTLANSLTDCLRPNR